METTVSKNKTAKIPTKNGNEYSYKYVDIAQIHEYLESNNMKYYQYIDRIDGDDYIMTVKIIDGKEQPALRGSRVVDATLYGVNNPAQQQGSALTYARRYSLLMAFGLATEDDDAQSLTTAKSDTKTTVYATSKQVEMLLKYYQGDNLNKLLEANNISQIEEMPLKKASEIIKKIMEKGKKENE